MVQKRSKVLAQTIEPIPVKEEVPECRPEFIKRKFNRIANLCPLNVIVQTIKQIAKGISKFGRIKFLDKSSDQIP